MEAWADLQSSNPSGHGRTCLLDVKRQDADGSRLLEKLRQLLVASEDLSFSQ